MNVKAASAPVGAKALSYFHFSRREDPNLPQGRAGILGATAREFHEREYRTRRNGGGDFRYALGLESFGKLGFTRARSGLSAWCEERTLARNRRQCDRLPVRVPKEEEAAALGAAIQALWCAECNAEAAVPIDIAALTDAHVSLEGGTSIEPEMTLVPRYEAAYDEYAKYLAALSPLYR